MNRLCARTATAWHDSTAWIYTRLEYKPSSFCPNTELLGLCTRRWVVLTESMCLVDQDGTLVTMFLHLNYLMLRIEACGIRLPNCACTMSCKTMHVIRVGLAFFHRMERYW